MKHSVKSPGISLSSLDIDKYRKRFYMVDRDRKGFITRIDIKNLLEVSLRPREPVSLKSKFFIFTSKIGFQRLLISVPNFLKLFCSICCRSIALVMEMF